MSIIGNLSVFPAAKEFWNPVKISRSYCHELVVQFFGVNLRSDVWERRYDSAIFCSKMSSFGHFAAENSRVVYLCAHASL